MSTNSSMRPVRPLCSALHHSLGLCTLAVAQRFVCEQLGQRLQVGDAVESCMRECDWSRRAHDGRSAVSHEREDDGGRSHSPPLQLHALPTASFLPHCLPPVLDHTELCQLTSSSLPVCRRRAEAKGRAGLAELDSRDGGDLGASSHSPSHSFAAQTSTAKDRPSADSAASRSSQVTPVRDAAAAMRALGQHLRRRRLAAGRLVRCAAPP